MFRRTSRKRGYLPSSSITAIKTILHIFDHTIKPILLYGIEI
jgi:hypothetical protein